MLAAAGLRNASASAVPGEANSLPRLLVERVSEQRQADVWAIVDDALAGGLGRVCY
jgi:hypothetical protein